MKAIYTDNADRTQLRIHPNLAAHIGLNESIMLLQIDYLARISKTKEIDGKKWTYQSTRHLQKEYFPFWSVATINRIINNLEEKKYIFVGNYNKNGYDRTRWLSVNYDEVEKIDSVLVGEYKKRVSHNETSIPHNETSIHQDDTTNNQNDTRSAQNDTTIPEITPETSPSTPKENTSEVNPSPFQNQTEEEFYEQAALVRKKEPFGQLFDAFLEYSGIPETMITGKSLDPIREWVTWGVTPTAVKEAIEQLREKSYDIVRPASISNALKIVMTQRETDRKKIPISFDN